MKFSVGYQIREDEGFIDTVVEYLPRVSEIYFSWEDFPNGRNAAFQSGTLSTYEMRRIQARDFERLKKAGAKFNLLLNGNCYGKYAQSRVLFNKIGDSIDYLAGRYELCGVTTTSLLIAKFVKQNFPELRVRASVNMEIGTVEGMDYVSEWFDDYYAARESNRNFSQLKRLRDWCDQNGKRLFGLANSGCLNNCSAHVFHDNLVAHEREIAEMDNAYQFEAQCYRFLSSEQNREKWLQRTNFIRPEDVGLYERFYDGCKLATRTNRNPSAVIRAYMTGSYSGSIPILLEPDHSSVFYPAVIENKKIPNDFTEHVATCSGECQKCSYCMDSMKKATVLL